MSFLWINNCCNQQQMFFILTFSCYVLAVRMLWLSWILRPFKLWTTFMHEFSHACAAWATGSKVTGIEVNSNEGGLTHWQTTPERMKWAQHIVLPAGYLGSTLWGFLIIISCANPFWARIMGAALVAALMICLGYATFGQTKEERLPLVGLCVGFGSTLAILTLISFTNSAHAFNVWDILFYSVLLFVGVLNALYSTLDVYDDTVRRTDERSDAYRYAQLWPCCFPKCVGCIWFLLALFTCIAAIVVYLSIEADNNESFSLLVYAPGPTVVLFASGARIFDCCSKRGYSSVPPVPRSGTA